MTERVRYNQGFAAVPDEFLQDEWTNSYHIAIYAVIAMHANTADRAWPSMNRIAKLVGASRSKVKSSINELVAHGWLTKEQRWNQEAGKYDANIYELARSLQGRAHSNPGVGHEVTGGGVSGDQEPDPLNQTQLNQRGSATTDYGAIMTNPDSVRAEFIRSISQLLPTTAWPDLPKQMAAITDMAAMTRNTQPTTPVESPEAFAQLVVSTYVAMKRKAKSEYWKTASFEPKAIKQRFGDVVTEISRQYERYQDKEVVGADPF